MRVRMTIARQDRTETREIDLRGGETIQFACFGDGSETPTAFSPPLKSRIIPPRRAASAASYLR